MRTHHAQPVTDRTDVDGPPLGGPLRVRPKTLGRHVAEIDALVSSRTLSDIIETPRATMRNRLSRAKAEVVLNCWRSTAQ